MSGPDDINFMRRCIDLASKAEGMTFPNPMVGSVIVNEGKIVGEGYHIRAGDAHAEVLAVNSVHDRSLLKFSTLYVNLEPCSHIGKTPPCADFIIANKIPRVVIGTIDTSEKVSGNGVEKLRNAGCEVITGVVEEECRRLNRRFFTYHEKSRPYITLKWAQSSDGYLDIIRKEGDQIAPNWITGNAERILVHRWRAMEQAILVGAGTVRADNPRLNVREWKGDDPIRIVLSGSGDINKESALNDLIGTLIVFTYMATSDISGLVKVKLNKSVSSSLQVADYLFKEGVQSLLIEGGAKVLDHFITTGLWDEARVFTGNSSFSDGVKAPEIKGRLLARRSFSGSILETYLPDNRQN